MCESLLERDAARLFEVSHSVVAFEEQPSVETWHDDLGDAHLYVPDFRLTRSDESVVDVEVKMGSALRSPEVKSKLTAIAKKYKDEGRQFRILTDEFLRREPRFENVRTIHRGSRGVRPSGSDDELVRRVGVAGASTFKEFVQVVGSDREVMRLIRTGRLGFDFDTPLTGDSKIWIREEGSDDPLRV